MRQPNVGAFIGFLLAAILSVPAWAGDASTRTAVPGTLNYVEGQVSIGNLALDSKSIGEAQLQPGDSLNTEKGKAEILLTPGVFLRVGDESSVKMISAGLTNTEVEVDRGHAMVEVAEIHPENSIRIDQNGASAQLLKTGLYDFNDSQKQFRVFDGKALVESGRQHIDVKNGREITLANNDLSKARKFDKKTYEEGDLFRWSSLRSSYVAEANVDAARTYAGTGWVGAGWWGAGWYWDPWFSAFTFVPGDGIFYSPFGWGFYSPWWVYQAPFIGYGYGYGYGGHFYHHFSQDAHNWGPGTHYAAGTSYAHGIYHGAGSTGSGFHSGPVMAGGRGFGGGRTSAGSFHGGSGGFHGGGGGHGR